MNTIPCSIILDYARLTPRVPLDIIELSLEDVRKSWDAKHIKFLRRIKLEKVAFALLAARYFWSIFKNGGREYLP